MIKATLFFAVISAVLNMLGFCSTSLTPPVVQAVQLDTTRSVQASDVSVNCCGDHFIRWEDRDSITNYLPPFEQTGKEQLDFWLETITDFNKKKAEILRNESIRKKFGFNSNTIVYEYKNLPVEKHRALAIIIENPGFHVEITDEKTCSTEVDGFGHFCGFGRLALLDIDRNIVLDTIMFSKYNEYNSPECIDLPFSLPPNLTYRVPGNLKSGLPHLLEFSDFNKDGLATEFPVYEYVACGFLETMILGYDPVRDRLMPSAFQMHVTRVDYDSTGIGHDTIYDMTYQSMPNFPLYGFLTNDTLRYAFYGGHGMETGELLTVWAEAKTGKIVGTNKIISVKILNEHKVPSSGDYKKGYAY